MDQQGSDRPTRTLNVVEVEIRQPGRVRRYDAGQLALRPGDAVVVPTESGNRVAAVRVSPRPAEVAEAAFVPRVIKKADSSELKRSDHKYELEAQAFRACTGCAAKRCMPMKVVDAEQASDGSKITVRFSTEGRVDFRDLVRDLGQTLHTRVEMKQVGPRDEAQQVGAVASCGRELCCSTWLHKPGGVSVKMARAQGLSPNPSKLAGMCGRLKCCLRYEYATYLELGRDLPALGTAVQSVKGDGVVMRQDILKQTVTIRREDAAPIELTLEDLVTEKAQ